MAEFEALKVAHLLSRAAKPLYEIVKLHDAKQADDMRRAAKSVPTNVSEGSQRSGGDRLHHYRIAAGSAKEFIAQTEDAIGWEYFTREKAAAALDLADRCCAMLWRLTH